MKVSHIYKQICIGVVADPGNRQIIKYVDVLSMLYSNKSLLPTHPDHLYYGLP